MNVREVNRTHFEVGEYHTVLTQLKAHPEKFSEYFLLDKPTFDYILFKIEYWIKKDGLTFINRKFFLKYDL